MTFSGSSWFTVSDRLTLSGEGREVGPIVVWLWGEHDISTDDALCATLTRAIVIDSPGLVLDLSEVDFMAMSTVAVIERARDLLHQRSRALTVRRPSRSARRVIDLCGVSDLLVPSLGTAHDETEKALGTFVAVPAAPRGDQWTTAPTGVPEYVSVRAGWAVDLVPPGKRAEGRGA